MEQPSFELHDIYRALSVMAEESDYIQSRLFKNSSAIQKRNTQVIYYDKQLDVLNNPLYHEKSLNPTRRSNSKMICMDIGNDLKYEIPTVTDLPFNEELTNMTGAQQVVWNDFDVQTNELVPVLYTVAN